MNLTSKIVVFDVDETLGYFVEFGIFWESLNVYIKNHHIDYELSQHDFNKILDLYPEFIRPNILSILNYLKHKKISKACNGVMIYTNNQGPKQWVLYIKEYFEHKIKYKLFNHIISAFKVNGKHIELCRSSHDKTYDDFIKCSKVPDDVQICYLDDTYYPEMNAENVYYIKVKPYTHELSFENMINTFISSEYGKTIITDKHYFSNFMKEHINKYQFIYVAKHKSEYDIDKIITKKIMVHLQNFFSKKFQMKDKRKKFTAKMSHKMSKNSKTIKHR